MSDEDKPSIVSGPSGDPRSMWLTRSDVDKEAQWAANKKKIEKPGYSYVRHTSDEYVSGIRNAADGYAWGAMQLNLTDLRAAMGNTDAGFDDTEIQKELAAQAARIEKNTQDISLLKTGKADKNHTHEGIGNDYNDSWIQPALDKKSDITHTHGSYSDVNHTHDTTHNHDKDYQAKGDYAPEIHGHLEYETKTDATIAHDTLTQSIAGKADSRHSHDGTYAPFAHEHSSPPHDHDNRYQEKGDYADETHFHDEYAESKDLNSLDGKLDTEIKDREAADEELNESVEDLQKSLVAGLLAVENNLRSEDSFYMKRLDEMLGDPTLADKETVFATSENWPPPAVDDKLYFKELVASSAPEMMYRGEELPSDTKYAIFHFANSERQEWKIKKIEYKDGVNHVFGGIPAGQRVTSVNRNCDVWFLSENWFESEDLGDRVEAGEILQAQIVEQITKSLGDQETLENKVNTLDSNKLNKTGANEIADSFRIRGTGGTYISAANGELGLYHVKYPENETHAANLKYVDDETAKTKQYVDDEIAKVNGASSGPTSKYDGNRFSVNGTSTKSLSSGEVMFLSGEASTTTMAAVTGIALPESEFDWDSCAKSGVVKVKNGARIAGYFQVYDIEKNEGRNVILNVVLLQLGTDPSVNYETGAPCYFHGVFYA